MRLQIDQKSNTIIQVENEPLLGAEGKIPINGQYLIPVPNGLDFPVDTTSYVLNGGTIDGGDVSSQGMARLLASYPQFRNIYFNPLLTADHVAELDFTFEFKDPVTGTLFTPRVQTGQPTGGVLPGQMPTSTAILPINPTLSTPRPGLLITDNIDIGPYTLDCDGNEVGADEFLLYWKLYEFEVSHDISSAFGINAGINEPSIRYIQEVAQEPSGFSPYLSINSGASWCPVGLLEPVAFCDKSKSIRIAFKNTGANKVYLACMALLF